MSGGVRVSLSSGEEFYVDGCDLSGLEELLNTRRLVRVGGRLVNSSQVAQVTACREIPSIEIPERLEAVE